MHRRRRTRQQRGGSGYGPVLVMKKRRRKQKGGILSLAAAIPALITVGKAVGLGAAGGAASYGAQKAMQAMFKKRGGKR